MKIIFYKKLSREEREGWKGIFPLSSVNFAAFARNCFFLK
jgi:hypothetical protein